MKRNFCLKFIALICIFSLISISSPAFSLSVDDLKDSYKIMKDFGGNWVQYKTNETITAFNLFDKYDNFQNTSWFSPGKKWKKWKEVNKARKLLKDAHAATKAYEKECNLKKVRDTGRELYEFSMQSIGLVGIFNDDVKKFHEMMTASDEMVKAALEFEKVPWWNVFEKSSKGMALKRKGDYFRYVWKDFMKSGGGRIVSKVIKFAKKWGKIGGTTIIDTIGNSGILGNVIKDVIGETSTNASNPVINLSTSVTSGNERSGNIRQIYELRENAHQRLIYGIEHGESLEMIKMYKEEFELLDKRYKNLMSN